MDYDDQMVYAYTMLRSVPELLRHFQELYPYICVDEAQDTSKIQHAIIALLASGSENLFMVGDEVFMASGRLIRRLCSHLKKIIRMQKSC